MFSQYLLKFIIQIVVLAGMSACASNRPHSLYREREVPPVLVGAVGQDSLRSHREHLLGVFSEPFVIEFDDQGELWDLPSWVETDSLGDYRLNGSQFETAREAINVARMARCDITLVMYVHGWKHNAKKLLSMADIESDLEIDKEESNLDSFTKFVASLNRIEFEKIEADASYVPRVYMGVYIGWRGTSWPVMRKMGKRNPVKLINQIPLNLTFWNRIEAADRVARASASYVMVNLAAEVKKPYLPSESGRGLFVANNRVVIIGHSMGGRIVERTVAQIIVGGLAHRSSSIRSEFEEIDIMLERVEEIEARGGVLEEVRRDIEYVENDIAKSKDNIERWRKSKDSVLDTVLMYLGVKSRQEESTGEVRELDALKGVLRMVDLELSKLDDSDENAVMLTNAKEVLLREVASLEGGVGNRQLELRILGEQGKLSASDVRLSELKRREEDLELELERGKQMRRQVEYRRNLALVRPADLILLINPASGSILSRQISEALDDHALNELWKNKHQSPWIISVSSRADWATSKVYGLGASLRWSSRSYRNLDGRSQFKFLKKPAPHNEDFRNFTLEKSESKEGDEALPKNNFMDLVMYNDGGFGVRGNLGNRVYTSDSSYELLPVDGTGSSLDWYWAVLADNELIKNHSGIFTPEVAGLVSGLMRIANDYKNN